jgi:SSXT protein (N-terminal region)
MPLTEEQVQGLLDENEDFLGACLDYQNMGRVYEAYQ